MQVLKGTNDTNDSVLHEAALKSLVDKKKTRKLSQFAIDHGISYSTLIKILDQTTKNPSASICEKILRSSGVEICLKYPDEQ